MKNFCNEYSADVQLRYATMTRKHVVQFVEDLLPLPPFLNSTVLSPRGFHFAVT